MYVLNFNKFLIEKASGSGNSDKELYDRWKDLVNMTVEELTDFINSPEGKTAGLTSDEAKEEGIHSGKQSAKWLLKMIPTGKTFEEAHKNWTSKMWYWAGRQNSFISRMSKMNGDLLDKDGNKTRKHLALLIWGNDPNKK